MERTQTRTMLNRALAGLYPESFYHPLWRHFSNGEWYPSTGLIQNLIQSAQQLLNSGATHDACQILLLCAVLQSRINNFPVASITAQQAWEFAEKNNLKQVSHWSVWGVCALSVNRGDYQTAIKLLSWLQERLRQEGQWVLANHLEMIKKTLSSGAQAGSYSEVILDMFSRWGEPDSTTEATSELNTLNELTLEAQQASLQPSKTGWGRFKRLFMKVLNFQPLSRWYRRKEEHSKAAAQKNVLMTANDLPIKRRTTNEKHSVQRSSGKSRKKFISTELNRDHIKPTITAHLLGVFRLALNDKPVIAFPHGQWRAIFEYLVFHHYQNIPREVLMHLFWPEADPASARNSLNVAFYNIRKALRSVIDSPIILFNNGAYGLNPDVDVWIDAEEFENNIKMADKLEAEGQVNEAKVKLEIAANLYQGDFLAEDLNEEWAVYPRERLRSQYLDTIGRLCRIYYHQGQYSACAAFCQLILKYDNCHEEAHCRLMRCYGRQNQYHLAIRQFHICSDALQRELGVEPATQTVKLFERARRREHTQPL